MSPDPPLADEEVDMLGSIREKARIAVAALAVLLAASLTASAAPQKVDVNTATQRELEALPGIGPATAAKIIAGRPYSSINDLARAGVSELEIEKLKPVAKAGRVKGEEKSGSKPEKSSKAEKPAKTEAAEKADKAEKPSKAEKAAASGPVDLNTASAEELEALPGVGKATAKKIVDGRPYSSVDDLAKAGVSASTIDKIRGSVVAHGSRSSSSRKSKSESAAPAESTAASSGGSSASSGGSSSHRSSSASTSASNDEEVAPRTPPRKGMVWVNTATKIYHYEGDRWYGRTKEGKFMTESDAQKDGYRAAKEGGASAQKP